MDNAAQKIFGRLKAASTTVGDVGWVLLTVLIIAGTAFSSFVVIEPGQAAVKVNNETQPGANPAPEPQDS